MFFLSTQCGIDNLLVDGRINTYTVISLHDSFFDNSMPIYEVAPVMRARIIKILIFACKTNHIGIFCNVFYFINY